MHHAPESKIFHQDGRNRERVRVRRRNRNRRGDEPGGFR